MLCLNEKCSTTRNLTTEKPIIKNHPDDKFETILFLPEIEGRKGEGGLRTQGYFKKSLPDKPLVTVITVVYNGEQHLEETVLSVFNQTYDNVEYIIIDGGSTDKTLEIIKKYSDEIDYWVSEPDKGIYDAMNKGWSIANQNSHIFFLGAGDLILSLPKIYELSSNKAIFGKVKMGDDNFFHSTDDWRLKLGNTLHHQALLIHKSLSIIVPFNIHYKIYADYDFNARLYKNGVNFFFSDSLIGYALPNGVSSKLAIKECLEIVKQNFGTHWKILALIYYFYQGLKYGFNKLSIFS